jgi:hypothetical protein
MDMIAKSKSEGSMPDGAETPHSVGTGYTSTIDSTDQAASSSSKYAPRILPPPEPFPRQVPFPVVHPPRNPKNKSAQELKAMKQFGEKARAKANYAKEESTPTEQTFSHEHLKKVRYHQLVRDGKEYTSGEESEDEAMMKKTKSQRPGVGNSTFTGREYGFTSAGSEAASV